MWQLELLRDTPAWEWPKDAGATLLSVLRDADADAAARLLAAELASETCVIDDELTDTLLAIAADGGAPEDLRCQAAISVGPVLELVDEQGFDEYSDAPISVETFERAKAALRTLHDTPDAPDDVRRSAIEAAVRAPQEWQAEAIRVAFDSADPAWRLTALFCARYVDGFQSEIVEALESDDEETLYEAVCAAGNWGLKAALPTVVGLLDPDESPKELVLAAIEAVVDIRPQEAERLLSGLATCDDEDIADAATEALELAVLAAGLEAIDPLASLNDDDELDDRDELDDAEDDPDDPLVP